VDAAYRIHTTLGPGLLESVYHAVLAYELAQRGLRTVSQQAIPVVYGTIRIDIGFRADLIVEDQVIVEIKWVEVLAPVHKKQLLTYLRLADKRLGLPINFNAALIKDGITRIVNGLPEESLAKTQRRQEPSEATGFPRLVGLRSKTSLESRKALRIDCDGSISARVMPRFLASSTHMCSAMSPKSVNNVWSLDPIPLLDDVIFASAPNSEFNKELIARLTAEMRERNKNSK
jgi:GxxExxY protein